MGHHSNGRVKIRDDEDWAYHLRLMAHIRETSKKNKAKKKGLRGKREPGAIYQALPPYARIKMPHDGLVGFSSRSHNPLTQQWHLVQHAFVKYPQKKFWKCLLRPNYPQRHIKAYWDWFILVAGGGSLRKHLKNQFTKKEVHYFLNSSTCDDVEAALGRAVLLATGLAPGSVALLARFVEAPYTEAGFWREVGGFFLRFEDQMPTKEELADLMDFIKNQKRNVPGYTLAGRTMKSVLREHRHWHRAIQAERRNHNWGGYGKNYADDHELPTCGIPDTKYEVKAEHSNARITYQIRQLRTAGELREEGRRMHHCVGSYAYSCVEGHKFVFTMESKLSGQWEKATTIALNSSGGALMMTQARGPCNNDPCRLANKVLGQWLAKNNIYAR